MIAAPTPCTARAVEHHDDAGQGVDRAKPGEDAQADREEAPPAEAVGERARRRRNDGRERERVGVDDRLQAAEAGVQVLGDAGERLVPPR